MKIKSTKKPNQGPKTVKHSPPPSGEPAQTTDRVTFTERGVGAAKYGLAGAGLIGGGFLAFVALEKLFGYQTGSNEMALQLALSATGGGLAGATYGATLGSE